MIKSDFCCNYYFVLQDRSTAIMHPAEWTLFFAVIVFVMTVSVADGHVNTTVTTSLPATIEPPTTATNNVSDYDDMANMTDEEYLNFVVDYITPRKSEWVFIVLHSIVFVVGLIGNALVCVAVYR